MQLIAGEAFYELNQLYNIRCDAVTPPALGTDVFGERTLKYAEVTVPDASFASYSNASGWRDFEWFKKKGAIDDTADDIADGETPRYYDLQGNRIDPSLAVPGIYIRRTSKTTSKIYLR